ncbi:MAG: uracil-DNA glycosylase [Chloroflexi bacterium RBG_16_51_16]|nr:MAG: uracil-DNA glycosylase [Chloroflexi bacterium RBG_16_51_16]
MMAIEELSGIAAEVSVCTKCTLHHSRKNAVPGEGPEQAEIMFIGEGPGFHENEQGRPFVGAAGQFLDQLLTQAGLKRSNVWITNIVKCRPPANRDPLPEEISACNLYLERQIKAIDPKIIISLGRLSMANYLPRAKIGSVHGQMHKVGGRFFIPMYHPAAALHQASIKPVILADFARLPELLKVARSELKNSGETDSSKHATGNQPNDLEDEPKQLNLF